MLFINTHYHPIDVAILWCNLEPHQSEIKSVAFSQPQKLLEKFPQWPLLHIYVERIYDAIMHHELPALYLGHELTSLDLIERTHITVRHSDLRIWISSYFPDDKPDFLFNKKADYPPCVSLGTYLIQKADAQSSRLVIDILEQKISLLNAEILEKSRHIDAMSTQIKGYELPTESSKVQLYLTIGALLDVVVGSSPNDQVQSIYKNQSALVEAIISRFPHTAGLSKRTLDRKFAEARRQLTRVS
ncbi:hypothetical protein [Pseudomonas putida]|uniref:hypothetical protein n=1 Tax=Pseudomonas putida TaxID=303 RepID=UPI0039E00683